MCATSNSLQLTFKGKEQALSFPIQVWGCSHTVWWNVVMLHSAPCMWDSTIAVVEQGGGKSLGFSYGGVSVPPLVIRATVPSQTSLRERNKLSQVTSILVLCYLIALLLEILINSTCKQVITAQWYTFWWSCICVTEMCIQELGKAVRSS